MPNQDLLSLWNTQLNASKDSKDLSAQSSSTQNPPEHGDSEAAPAHRESIPREAQPQAGKIPQPKTTSQTPPDSQFRAAPSLSGRLVDYLGEQPSRKITAELPNISDQSGSWIISDPQAKLSIAVALILTSNIARFSGTALSETTLVKTRNDLLRTLNAKDAVNAEVEAYELLNWLATALNENLKASNAPSDDRKFCPETTEAALIGILTDAIEHKRDITMRYYTGSRGAFSERRITPIEITAEKYLIAFCHVRDEERVFRLSRIVSLVPIPNPGESQQDLLCYPNPTDTALPPLPETPAPKPADPPKPRKKSSPKATSTKQRLKQPKKSPAQQEADPPKSKSLFDLMPPAKPASPKKKKKAPAERLIPGLFSE
ncbi:MAG: WYL domain-containing protein [Proteobacteria bacterium]|nr:WYL domain-containing protein [Pseudomonadota bacterium]